MEWILYIKKLMASLTQKPYYNVERRGLHENGWYQVMLAPFKTFEEAILYIEKYRYYYSLEHQNYKITYEA
jgi:hypothetical protein